ncbi:hypothetical protein HDU89_005718, partial [Geranomyces variabilis]
ALLPSQKLLPNVSESEGDAQLGRLKELVRQVHVQGAIDEGARIRQRIVMRRREDSEGQTEVASDGKRVTAICTMPRPEVSKTAPFEAGVKVLGPVCGVFL